MASQSFAVPDILEDNTLDCATFSTKKIVIAVGLCQLEFFKVSNAT